VFAEKKDKPARDAWAKVIAHAYTQRPDWATQQEAARLWDAHLIDLRADLYQLLGAAVGYPQTLDYIKTHMYYPQYHVDAELEQMQIRKQLAKAITEDGLRVVLVDRSAPDAPRP
jgi:hypothetical protein